MFAWLKTLVSGFGATTAPSPVNPEPAAASMQVAVPPLYFLDVDDADRLFLRFVHATSSENAPSIRALGLRPLHDVRARLLAYLALVFPEQDAEGLLSMITKDTNQQRNSLVIRRLQAEAEGRATLSLLPLGSHGYLGSAASNAVFDGGEVFRAAREAVNSLCSITVPPPYPDAVPTVFVVRHYLTGDPPDLQLEGTGDHGVSLREAVASDFTSDYWCTYGTEMELAVSTAYQPAHIEGEFRLVDFKRRRMAKASPSAITVATAMLAAA
ncbi:hypothetical protein SAMN05192549_103171 [Duganella sacchari]|uniref:Uncharacterized protein n=1 Tax=Duganella sacchari TaxID=551987 RepID=A0A1M7MH63_9BURK|nr:hypothetical protein [Duganella sacchari]SHM90175.1 hypothetical protein SAMN05192549_103171 [Duganella sacchari]